MANTWTTMQNRVAAYFDETRIASSLGTAGELWLLGGAALSGNIPRVCAGLLGLVGQGQLLLRSGDVDQRWADAGKWWIAQFAVLMASGAIQSPHDWILGLAGGISYLILNTPEGEKKIHNASEFMEMLAYAEKPPKVAEPGFSLTKTLTLAASTFWNDMKGFTVFGRDFLYNLGAQGPLTAMRTAMSTIRENGQIGIGAKLVIYGTAVYAACCLLPAIAPASALALGIKGGIDITGLGLSASWIVSSIYQLKVEKNPAIDMDLPIYHHTPEMFGSFQLKGVDEKLPEYDQFVEAVKIMLASKKDYIALLEEGARNTPGPGNKAQDHIAITPAQILGLPPVSQWPKNKLPEGAMDLIARAESIKTRKLWKAQHSLQRALHRELGYTRGTLPNAELDDPGIKSYLHS